MPEVKAVKVGHIVGDSRQYDYALILEFNSLEDLKQYGNSEVQQRCVKDHNAANLAAGFLRLMIDIEPAP